jgi:stage II sporulation protein D (peptidoglycan lytic transglycosylase)
MSFKTEDPTGHGDPPRPPAGLLILLFLGIFLTSSNSFSKSISIFKSEPTIRVCLAEKRESITLHLLGKYKLTYQNVDIADIGNSTISFSITRQGKPSLSLPNQQIQFFSPISIELADSIPPPVSAGDPDGITFKTQVYPGAMTIIPEDDGSLRLINSVPLETYLRGVVPNELVNNLRPDELQACMAQAIAARNYAFFRMSNVDSFANGPLSRGFDVYSDTRDQVYSGTQRYKSLADSAIQFTAGMIVEYEGRPARCFFHSTCGGHTEAVQNVWQGQPALPYLRGVSDIDSSTGEPFCIYNPNFYWTVSYTGRELTRIVKANLGAANPMFASKLITGDVSSVKVLDRFSSTRVDSLEIVMDDGDVYFVRGDRTRYLFKGSDGSILRSSMIKILVLRNYGGSIRKIIIKGQGNGHGVGMCQWGALGMSRLGYSYKQILAHYYPGTVIEKVY